jgi:phage replication initiation protein
MCSELVKIFNVKKNDIERQKSGGSGYKYRAKFPGGQILWGGANQRGTINVSLSGEGCSRIENWPAIQTWLEIHQAKLKRVDLTCDDITGETLTIEKMADWYRTGGFGAGGRQPSHSTPGDWLHGQASVKGRTLNVGNRTSGKMFRGYEKGKQLGDPTSRWVRAELELHDKLRVIPYDVIKRPGQYLAGGYPCLAFLNIVQSKIKTVLKAAKVAFDRAMHNARQQVGKLVNLALSVFGGDYAMVVERLRREGIPKRIEPYSYHVQQSPESLDDAECFASGTTY